MKLTIEEVLESVKDELLCYEEGEKVIAKWEREFQEWMTKHKGKHRDISVEKNSVLLKIKDEEEIFEMADSYMDALSEGSVKQYWEKF